MQKRTFLLDFPARPYDASLCQFWTDDPLREDFYVFSPRTYCMGNPISIIDPTGCDTVHVDFVDNKWEIGDPIISKGDDVFIVNDGRETKTYTYYEGEYGNRVVALNLHNDGKGSYNLGVYHVSGEEEGGTGFYVTPGGDPSNKDGSGATILDGQYPITTPNSSNLWRTPGIGGAPQNRGVRFHYGWSDARNSTEGCFVVSYGYDILNGRIKYDHQTSKYASMNFNNALGAIYHLDYTAYTPRGPRNRTGAIFGKQITHSLILKSR